MKYIVMMVSLILSMPVIASDLSAMEPVDNMVDIVGFVDINTADVSSLMQLQGIGEARAQAIIMYREENGPFETIEALTNVNGISQQWVSMNQEQLIIGE